MRGRQAARKQRELAETSVPLAVERAGLKGCWRLRMCQQAIRILRATADLAGFLPARLVTAGRRARARGWSAARRRARPRPPPNAACAIPPSRVRRCGAPLAGLVHARRETGVADQLARRGEAGDVADLARQGQPEQVTDAGDRLEQHDTPVVSGRLAQLAFKWRDALVEQIDHRQRLGDRHRRPTSRRHRVRLAAPPRSGARSRSSEIRRPHCVSRPKIRFIADARNWTRCIRRRSCSRSARSSRGRQPERRHRVAPAELGKHPRIDLVGVLAGQRRDVAGPCARARPAPASRPPPTDHEPRPRRSSSRHTLGHRCRASERAWRAHPRRPQLPPRRLTEPPSPSAHHAARRYAQSIPTYCIAGPPFAG